MLSPSPNLPWWVQGAVSKMSMEKQNKKSKGKLLGSTKQDDRKVINAGDVPESGIYIKPTDMRESTNEEYGKFWSLECELYEGDKETLAVLNFGGKKLHKLLKDNWAGIKGDVVVLKGFGEGFERYYELYAV